MNWHLPPPKPPRERPEPLTREERQTFAEAAFYEWPAEVIDRYEATVQAAEERAERAEEALRFYAAGATWNGPPHPPPIRFDLGHRAQVALAPEQAP